jgi:hypothetical protein
LTLKKIATGGQHHAQIQSSMIILLNHSLSLKRSKLELKSISWLLLQVLTVTFQSVAAEGSFLDGLKKWDKKTILNHQIKYYIVQFVLISASKYFSIPLFFTSYHQTATKNSFDNRPQFPGSQSWMVWQVSTNS